MRLVSPSPLYAPPLPLLPLTTLPSRARACKFAGRDISAHVEASDDLFEAAQTSSLLIETTGIGDGGNELGMGAVNDAVRRCIPLGELIGCATSTSFLVPAGVSNWGGYVRLLC